MYIFQKYEQLLKNLRKILKIFRKNHNSIYYQENGEVAIEKLKNSIYINNPGGLISSLSVEEFGKSSRPCNRLLADLLSRTMFMEKVGTGIQRIKEYCTKNKNSVDFKFNDINFFMSINSTVEKTVERTVGTVLLNER